MRWSVLGAVPHSAGPLPVFVVVVQAFRALSHHPASLFRSRVSDRGVLFQVTYANEPGIDVGGLYREALSWYVPRVR